MKICLQLIIVLALTNVSFAQDSFFPANRFEFNNSNDNNSKVIVRNVLYFEGSVVLQSANFETKLYRSKSSKFQLNGRVGFGYFYLDFFGATESAGGILGLNFIVGKQNNYFDASIGGFIGSDSGVIGWPIAAVGYRYQKPSGGFLFKTHLGTLGIDVGLGYSF